MVKTRVKLYNLQAGYFQDLARDPSEDSLDFMNSPLVGARRRLASYVGVVLWRLYKSDVDIFGDCFTLVDGISRNDDSFDERISDELEATIADFRLKIVDLEQRRPTLKESDFADFLEELDRLLEAVESAREKRHGLATALQRHFYHTVTMALEGYALTSPEEWNEWGTPPAPMVRAFAARDALYLEAFSGVEADYLKAVREVMAEPAYGEWIAQAMERKSWLSPLPLDRLEELTEALEVELLWRRLTIAA